MKNQTPFQLFAFLLHSHSTVLFGTSGIILGLIQASIIYNVLDVDSSCLPSHPKYGSVESTCRHSDVLKFDAFGQRQDAAQCITTVLREAQEIIHGQDNAEFGEESQEQQHVLEASLSVILGDHGAGGCQRSTGRTCRLFSCNKRGGPTECLHGECVCKPGFCSDRVGVCRGCGHFTMEVRDLPPQHTKAGYYSAIAGFFKAGRPVWKQFYGENWVWYCQRHSCWVVSDIAPNDHDCSAGVVSPRSFATATPFDLLEGGWKFWNGFAWIDNYSARGNEVNPKPHFHLRCQDFRIPGAGGDYRFESASNSVTRGHY